MAKGPLAVRWLDWTLDEPHAGAISIARVGLENTGTISWRNGICLGYHWLDERGNPIVWDGVRTGSRRSHRARRRRRGTRTGADPARAIPVRARPRRRAPRLVLRARRRSGWRRRRDAPRARPRRDSGVDRAGRDWPARRRSARRGLRGRRRRDQWDGGLLHRRPRALEPYGPGRGRVPGFSIPWCAHPSSKGSSSNGCRTSPGCRRTRRQTTSPGSTTAGSCCRPDSVRARSRSGRRSAGRRMRRRERDGRGDREVDHVGRRGACPAQRHRGSRRSAAT